MSIPLCPGKNIVIWQVRMRSAIYMVLFFPAWVFSQTGGMVIDQQTRLPLENARLVFPDSTIMHTDATGIFYMRDDLAEGEIQVSHIGYVSQQYRLRGHENILIEMLPDPRELAEVQVSATHFSGKLKDQPGNISLLIREDIRFNSQEHISAWLNQVPGIFMHHGTYSTNRLTIRGMGSRDPYGSSRVKAYLNDIPITGGDGLTVVEDLSLTGLSRIEILKGPASALYGTGLGGTLRLFTPYPGEKGLGINTLHQMGSFGLQKHALSAHYKKSNSSLALDLGRQQSNGFRENSSYHNNHLMLNGDIFTRHIQLGVLFNYIDLKAQIPSSLDEETFQHSPKAAAENWNAIKGYEKYQKYLTGISISNDIGSVLRMKTVFFVGAKNLFESRPFNILRDNTMNLGIRSRLELETSGLKAILGFELLNENIDWSTYETLQGEQGGILDAIRENRFYTNLFNLYHWKVNDRMIFEAGVNLAFIRFRLVKSNNPAYPEGSFRYPVVFSPRLGINYQLGHQLTLFSAAGHGFSTPSFEETLLPEGIRNNKLRPEKGWNLELGMRGDVLKKHLTYDLTGYMMFVKDLLVTKRISEEIFTGINAGRSFHAGLESIINWNLLRGQQSGTGLFLVHSFQFSGNRFIEFVDDDADYSGNELPGIPDYKTDLIIKWLTTMNIETSMTLHMVGKQYLADDNMGIYQGYQTIDWNISYSHDFSSKFGFFLAFGLNNLLDQSHASMILINAPSFGGLPPRYYYPGMPRNFYITLSLKIG
jgi:iron complex outermembrane receptor protein